MRTRTPSALLAACLGLGACAAPRIAPSDQDLLPHTSPPLSKGAPPAIIEAARPPGVERQGFRVEAPDAPAPAQPRLEAEPRHEVNVILDRAPVSAAAEAVLGQTLQRSYRVDPAAAGEVSVRLVGSMTETEVLQTFDQALRAAGSALVEGGGGGLAILPAANAPVFSRLSGGSGGGTSFYAGGTAVYRARNISASEMVRVLQPLAAGKAEVRADEAGEHVFISGDPGTVNSLVRSAELFDVDWLRGRSFQYYPLKYAAAKGVFEDVEKILGGPQGPLGTQVELIEVDRLNAVIVAAKSTALLDQTVGWIEKLDQPASPSARRLRVMRLSNMVADDFVKVISDLFSKAPTAGAMAGPSTALADAAITADARSNSVIMYADDAEYQSLLEVVRQLDVTPAQVMIEATVAEVTLNDNLQFGVQWYLNKTHLTAGLSNSTTVPPIPTYPGLAVSYMNGDFTAVLSALSQVTDVELLSTPRMLVLANETAKLQVGDEVPIITQTSTAAQTTAEIVNSVQYRDTGVVLNVTPRVGDHGRIFIDIQQEVSAVTNTTSSAIDSPTIEQRKFSTQIQVEDGQMVALGGLVSSSRTKSRSGIPILGRIPLVGNLFGSRNDSNARTELVVFLKPRLIQSRAEADRVTDELAERLHMLGFGHGH